jgi:hypothetical protein
VPARSETLRVAVAKSGAAARGGDPEKIEKTRRDLAAEQLASYIEKTVSAAPPLTSDQQDRLALLLRGAA